jgi:ABC-type phosphate/phosphonate transport system substrate-binding protein
MKKITLILLTLVLFGCGGGNHSSSSSTNFKYDLIPKDTTTTAEEGWHPGHQPM